MAKTARYLNPDRNPRAYITGIPTRNLSEDEFNALTDEQKESVDNSGIYVKSNPDKAAKAEVKKEEKKTE